MADRRLSMPVMTAVMLASGACMHYHTPMIGALAADFDVPVAKAGWVASTMLLGYVVGIVMLGPLGDLLDKRKLILAKLVVQAVALALCAVAPSVAVLAAATFVVGACSTNSQDMIPLVAQFAVKGTEGRTIAALLSAMLVGILFGRVVGGVATQMWGWRSAFWIAAAFLALLYVPLDRTLPAAPPTVRLPYRALLASLFELLRRFPALRHASLVQLLLGCCYGGFWATVAPTLTSLHDVGPAAAGLIGIPGAAGVLVAGPTGRWGDRHGPYGAVAAGAACVAVAYVVLGFAAVAIALIVAGAMLLDTGIRASMVANQSFVASLDSAARSRTNVVFVAHMFGGNALGALVASSLWTYAGWLAVVCGGFIAATGALAVHLVTGDKTRRRKR